MPMLPHYDGSVLSACRLYQRHPYSRFHKVKHNTRKSYTDSLKIIERTVGKRLIRNLTVLDVQHWYDEWRKPAFKEGPERIDRAHDAVSMFKTVLRFVAAALRRPECKQLISDLRTPAAGPVRAWRRPRRGNDVRPGRRLHSQGARNGQRRRHSRSIAPAIWRSAWRRSSSCCFGKRTSSAIGGARAAKSGPAILRWENIPGWRWRMKTSKSKYRTAAEFDLSSYSLLYPLLEAVPHEERVGAIVKGEHGLPVRERSYRKWFRQIARAAGIPDEVWSMDSRAGGATEAEEAGAAIDAIQGALTHSKKDTTLRYLRKNTTKIADRSRGPSP